MANDQIPPTNSSIDVNVLHDHYKESFALIKAEEKRRERYLLYIFIVITIMIINVSASYNIGDAISQYLNNQYGVGLVLNLSFIELLVWFVACIMVVRYNQMVVYIERQYEYIHKIENDLSSHNKNTLVFRREGEVYLSDYPVILRWISFVYKIIIPLIIYSFFCFMFLSDMKFIFGNYISKTIGVLFFFIITVTSILSLTFLHRKPIDRYINKIWLKRLFKGGRK
jgi:hypothetical protein